MIVSLLFVYYAMLKFIVAAKGKSKYESKCISFFCLIQSFCTIGTVKVMKSLSFFLLYHIEYLSVYSLGTFTVD